jgi:hypothetical protein
MPWVPLAPGRDDANIGIQGISAELETHLVITLAGGAVRHRVGAGLGGDFD